jgi:hypothetical protein
LVTVWRVRTVGKFEQLRVRQSTFDSMYLLKRAVFIVQALNGKERAGDGFDRLR